MQIGDRARFFDPILWGGVDVGDNDQFFVPATVIKVYNRDSDGRELVDLEFDHRPQQISKGHFTDHIKELKSKFIQADKIEKGDTILIGGNWCYCNDRYSESERLTSIMFVYRKASLAGHLVVGDEFPILKRMVPCRDLP